MEPGNDTHPHSREQPRLSDHFCIAPWVHLHVTQNGNVTPCCRIAEPVANVNRESLADIWNGAGLREFRRTFLAGRPHARCAACYDHEAAGSESYRQFLNARFVHHLAATRDTAVDGTVEQAKPIYWDIRFSNICNLRCRTCWHGASSRWFDDSRKLGIAVADQAFIQNVDNSKDFLEALQTFAPEVEEIVFAGGEPLLTAEHFDILEKLIVRGNRGVRIRCVTNLTELRYRRTDVIDLWNQFEHVEVNASLDGVERRGEMIRKDLSWPRFVENAQRVRAEVPHVDFGIHATISVLNLFHVPRMQRLLLEQGLVDFGKLELRALHDPDYYNIKMLPRRMKRRADALLREHADWVAEFGRTNGADAAMIAAEHARIISLIDFMWAADLSEHVFAFAQVTRALDKIRSETCADLCPELRPLIDRPFRASLRGSARHLRHRAALRGARLLPSIFRRTTQAGT